MTTRELIIIIATVVLMLLIIAITLVLVERRRKEENRQIDLRLVKDRELMEAQKLLPPKYAPTLKDRITLPEENDALLERANAARVALGRPPMGLRPFMFIRSQYASASRPKLSGETLLHYVIDYGYTEDTKSVVKPNSTLRTWKEEGNELST